MCEQTGSEGRNSWADGRIWGNEELHVPRMGDRSQSCASPGPSQVPLRNILPRAAQTTHDERSNPIGAGRGGGEARDDVQPLPGQPALTRLIGVR